MMKEKFPWRDFLRQVAVIAVPVALQNLLSTTGSMVDTMMIGALGQLTVGAVGLCAQFSSLMFSCYWGFVGGGMLFFAQYWGNKDHDGINRSYGLTVACMLTVGIVFALLGMLAPEWVMRLYTDKVSLQEIGVKYLRIVSISYPISVLSMAMAALLRTTERVKIPLVGAIGSTVTNMLLNFLLIQGRFGFPAMGIQGAALATVCASVVNLVIIVVLAKWQKHPYLLAVTHHFRWRGPQVKEYFIKCAPIIANELFIGVGMMIINIVLGRQSEEAIAAIAVFRVLEGLVIGFFAGFSNAASVVVGKEVGAGNLEIAYQRAWRLVYLCMSVIVACVVCLLCFHAPIFTLMSLHGESFRLCLGMLMIYGVAVVIRMANWTQNDTFRSAGDAAYGTLLEISFMFAMVVPCVCITGLWLKLPFLLIFACCYIDEPIRFVLMHIHLYNGKWIKPVTPEGRAALPAFREARKHH